jgi:hypothetical protein
MVASALVYFTGGETATVTKQYRFGGPPIRSGFMQKKKSLLLPGIEPRFLGLHLTVVITLSQKFQLNNRDWGD